ncbi:MAG: adenylate/guanylate cyclase domain-containing protein [Simkaniaceae bacterium]
MKLRYRLFIWVAGVFCIAFAASFFLENYMTRAQLKRAYQDLTEQLNTLNERKKNAIEDYLADMLYKIQAEVDAVLQGVAKYSLIRKGFTPTVENLKEANWLDAASLMITNKRIDFIQSLNEEALMSEIIIDRNTLNDILLFPVAEDFSLVAVKNNQEEWEGPYVAVTVSISSLHGDVKSSSEKEAEENYFAFFSEQALLNFNSDANHPSLDLSINLLEPFLKWIEVPSKTYFLEEFLKNIKKSQSYLKSHPDVIPTRKNWETMIQKKGEALEGSSEECNFNFFRKESPDNDDDVYYQDQIDFYVERFIEHYNKVGLIWGLCTLTHTDIFGNTPLTPNAPIGMGMMDPETECGMGLISREVFYDRPLYHVEAALEKMEALPEDFQTTHLDIISPEGRHDFYFGNTLKLQTKENNQTRTGYLTVGMDGGAVLGTLSRSMHRTTLFISGGRIVRVTSGEGVELHSEEWYHISADELLSKEQGVIPIGDEDYYFLHVIPYEQSDLHFFIFTPKDQEFALVDAMNEEAEEILRKISMQMRLASIGGLLFVLIFLNNIAKRITRPISHLATVSTAVAGGKLLEVEIPSESKQGHQDEIDALYHSFFEMVKGLKEKEKVRGVLNKVVSKEIAEEALKGNIQLGGEEKKVTVFFADIRHFTAMTEKMSPKEVIQLVNTCMTKVSDIIDKQGGVIDKYVGDEVMALFGAPIEKKDSAYRAVLCGIEIIEALKQWNQEKTEGPPIEMGIGIHTGNVVVGNMGAENRLNYTVLGANVNLASRLCSEADPMQVLISEDTLNEEGVKESIQVEAKETVDLKGFTKPVSVFSVKRK